MRLYYLRGACSLADHIVLEWTGAAYEAIQVQREKLRDPAFLAINPLGAVPALQADDGWVLTQNAAILNYLADSYPQARLGGDGTARGRAEVNRWLALCNADIHPWFKPIFVPGRFIEDKSAHEELKRNARVQLRNLFQKADAQLEGKLWLTGERSIADPYLFILLRWARALHVDPDGVDLGGFANLDRFFDNMLADAGVQKALREEGLA
ncbi:glutathione S-transferase N-terminal domain-containing protein [Luteimonas aquatica]|uniref:glutathione S-transferase N-terminal domain-containing protein n=1 Tax=Luteimonas aquatica TaxID=450364 RepID=UPI001F55EC16|nr:glutathione S-transferase N-terminal domain-containing protein [Luteimonas aquatica]